MIPKDRMIIKGPDRLGLAASQFFHRPVEFQFEGGKSFPLWVCGTYTEALGIEMERDLIICFGFFPSDDPENPHRIRFNYNPDTKQGSALEEVDRFCI